MPRGDKSSYGAKQKRMAGHIEEGYERRGVGPKEAGRRAWATVNKETGGARGGRAQKTKAKTGTRSPRARNPADKRSNASGRARAV